MIKRIKGFTLIELLVVIAIIALLLAIVMPALTIAKQQAQAIVCLAHIRQVTYGWYLYADENDGKVVGSNNSVNPYDNRNFVSSGETEPTYAWVCTPQTESGTGKGGGSSIEEKQVGIKKGLVWPYMEAVDAFHCPGDKRFLNAPTNTGFSGLGGWRSYSVVGGMNGEEWTYYTRLKKISGMKSPGDKYVMIEESDGRGYNINSWIVDPDMTGGSGWVDPVAIWHNERSNLGYADGHAEKHRWVDETTIEAAREGRNNASVKLGDKDIEYMRRFYPYDQLR